MQLSTDPATKLAQLQAIKAWVVANNASVFDQSAANLLNAAAAPDYWVWDPLASVEAVYNAITWKNFTPADAPDATATYTNRVLLCQSKQINLQTILFGRTTLDAEKSSTRTGIKDALQDLPSGAAGAPLDAGWVAARNSMERKATVAEKLLAAAGNAGTQADASTMGPGARGPVTLQNVIDSEST